MEIDEFIQLLTEKLHSSTEIVNGENTLVINSDGSINISNKMPKSTWAYVFSNVIPQDRGFFFDYENKGEEAVCISSIKLIASVGSTMETYVTVHRITGELTRKNIAQIQPVRLKGTNSANTANTSISVTGITGNQIIERIPISAAFAANKCTTKIQVMPGERIGLKWGADIGSLAGVIKCQG